MEFPDVALFILVMGTGALLLPMSLIVPMYDYWFAMMLIGIQGFGSWLGFVVHNELRKLESV